MGDKFYQNDYKRMMGLDQTRTASEKLLDKAIGTYFGKAEIRDEVKPVKKIKEEHLNISSEEYWGKVIKSIENNTSSAKLSKSLAILKKCLNDQAFLSNEQINSMENWMALVGLVLEIDGKMIGNYSENNLVIELMLEILQIVLESIRKLSAKQQQIKIQQIDKVPEVKEQDVEARSKRVVHLIFKGELQVKYCKMFTDDSFTFNKQLSQLRKQFFSFYSLLIQKKDQQHTKQNRQFVEKLLMKLFKLGYDKHEWMKTSLAQFFKQFNISYKHLLGQSIQKEYLVSYNIFLTSKKKLNQMSTSNILGNGGKGGRVTSIQFSGGDGLDRWTTRQ